MENSTIIKELSNPNYFLMGSLGLSLIYLLFLFFEYQKYANFTNGKNKKPDKKNSVDLFFENLTFFIKIMGHSKDEELIKMSIFIVIIIPFGYLISQGSRYLSFVYPIIIISFLNILFKFSFKILNNQINKTLPDIIDMTYRVMTRNNSLKSIMYEVSMNYKGFLKEPIIDMVINMESKPEVLCLNEFSSKFTNMHMRSYVILLTSFLSRSTKEDVMENLKALSTVIKIENKMKKDIKSEKMGTSVQNWFLSVAAILAFLGNLKFNEGSADFFFQSPQGLACLIVGFGLLLVTVLFNVKSMS